MANISIIQHINKDLYNISIIKGKLVVSSVEEAFTGKCVFIHERDNNIELIAVTITEQGTLLPIKGAVNLCVEIDKMAEDINNTISTLLTAQVFRVVTKHVSYRSIIFCTKSGLIQLLGDFGTIVDISILK